MKESNDEREEVARWGWEGSVGDYCRQKNGKFVTYDDYLTAVARLTRLALESLDDGASDLIASIREAAPLAKAYGTDGYRFIDEILEIAEREIRENPSAGLAGK